MSAKVRLSPSRLRVRLGLLHWRRELLGKSVREQLALFEFVFAHVEGMS